MMEETPNVKAQSVLKNKNYVLLFLGTFVSNIGNMLYNFAISLYILDVTNNNAIIAGIYMATGGIIFAVLAPFGGAIVDRLDRVKVVYITDFIRGITILAAGYLLFTDVGASVQIPILFACTIILAINNALFEPAVSALPANILETNQLQQSNALIQGSNSLYSILGVFFGAALYEIFGIEVVFIVNGLTFIFSAISEMFITTKTKMDPDHVVTIKSVTRDIGEGFKYVLKMKPIFYLMLMAMLFNFFLTPVFSNGMPYLFKAELNTSSFYYSLVTAMFSIGIIVSSIILGIKKQEERIFRTLKIGFIGMMIFFVLFVLNVQLHIIDFTSLLVFIIPMALICLLMGVYNGYVNIPTMTALQVNVDKQLQGRVFSFINVIAMGLTPISIALAGIVIQKLGLMVLFYIGAIAVVILTFAILTNKYIKQL